MMTNEARPDARNGAVDDRPTASRTHTRARVPHWLRPVLRRASLATIGALGLFAAVAMPSRAFAEGSAAGGESKKIFNSRCTACHTFGRGIKVGPDLKGVNERRKRPWLLTFIRGSSKVIKSGDETATKLFAEFKQQRMPDWTDLSEPQVVALLDWFAANGPEQKEPDERLAEVATPKDIERARGLFFGKTPLASGGLACGTCHSVREGGDSGHGGSLGPDLSNTYAKFQDRALTLFFKRPCSPRAPDIYAATYLQPEESFALKAYLRQVALSQPSPPQPPPQPQQPGGQK